MLTNILCGELITPSQQLRQAVVSIDQGVISSIDKLIDSPITTETTLDARDAILIPGLVDLQVNGALGWSFQADHHDHYAEILAFHLAAGTTTLLPTIITAPEAVLLTSLAALVHYSGKPEQPGPHIAGIHIEGPFLNPEKSGAHDPSALCQPDKGLAEKLVQSAQGLLKVFTIAPELPNAVEVIRYLADLGITVSAGHTAARYHELQAAIAAGLKMVTHAGNASDWPHRAMGELGFLASEPGLVGTLMADQNLAGGIIMDGFHFHPALLAPLFKVKGPDGLFLVSDASTVAGCPAGEYDSGGLVVTIHPQGFATSGRGGGWLAGSTITLLEAVQRAVQLAGLSLQSAVHLATLAPAKVIGIDNRSGQIAPGMPADMLVLNQDLSLRHIILGGELINTGS